tara:strand:- start:979 stop:1179 length:201 start_codon:yes stop_codon:yes gene_type:complete
MFKFTHESIDSQKCQPVVAAIEADNETSIEFAFSIATHSGEFKLTESELQYMMDEVKKLKNTNWSC